MKVYASEAWTGPPKIILGIDIGATQSAVSFSYLHPGGPHHVIRVTEWPGQPVHAGQGRVPSLIWYDKDKKPVSFGAEALLAEAEEAAEENDWQRVSLFKLHLHPESVTKGNKLVIPPLINGLSLLTVYTDFLRYLLEHVKNIFPIRVLDGQYIWETCHQDMSIVLTHPNGWSFQQQSTLRKALIDAGYISDVKANSNIVFVSEAEASTHFCLFHSELYNRLEANTTFVVCDAGGSTVDSTAYRVISTSPVFLIEEIKSSACIQAGGAVVDDAFRAYLLAIVDRIAEDESSKKYYLRTGITHFEENVKRGFEIINKNYKVALGTGRLVDQQSRIRQGFLTLDGHTIETFFDNSVNQIVASILQQMEEGCQHLFLVGGFGESRYLRKVVESKLLAAGHTCSIHVTSDPYAKPVADGAVVWYGHNSVTSRAARMSYGITVQVIYDPKNSEHQCRKPYRDVTGLYMVDGMWFEIAKKDTIMKTDGTIRKSFCRRYEDPNPPSHKMKLSIPLLAVADGEGTKDRPESLWSWNKDGYLAKGFEQICTVTADLSGLQGALMKRTSKKVYYQLDFLVALRFGGTEISASIEWTEKGESRTGPATLVAVLPVERLTQVGTEWASREAEDWTMCSLPGAYPGLPSTPPA